MSAEQLHAILAMGAENPPPANGGPQDMRDWFEAMMAPTPTADGIAVVPVTINGLDCEILHPANLAPDRLVVYVHGGGWLFGSPRSHRVIASNLARASGCAVLSVQYRLAPENPAPAAHDDVFAAYEWALAQGYPDRTLALVGDSAGGNMALATAIRARDAGLPLPAALVLMSPALDLTGQGASHSEMADAPLVDRGLMGLFTALYLGDGDPASPAVTPFDADMTGLPPTLIHVGSWELLRSDSQTLAARMQAAGVAAELRLWDGMCHNHQLFAPFLDEGMESLDQAGVFLRAHLLQDARLGAQ
ncbi:alpha/beta hydrolase [Roseinatronobacter alkalisoli]|uniref:Alpha/beta hydrolase n=1 Tax=Roseinatronobacter alkalisoli TaxID=3028235 RepID=A0ABT5T8C9_9RHOB|nr:alpha/beta hydrolase [Roseinatronobacter sp. HJB301]MDD7970955.1 alpha/beta hydrolase [Roseinatronobacter sp. HJB301]